MSSPDVSPTPEPPRFSVPVPRPLWIFLATVVLAIVTVGVQVALPIYREEVSKRAIIEASGLMVSRERQRGWTLDKRRWGTSETITVDISEAKVTDDSMLAHVGALRTAEVVSAKNTLITDGVLAHLKGLKKLRSLDLDNTMVT